MSRPERVEADQIEAVYSGSAVGLLAALAAAATLHAFLVTRGNVPVTGMHIWLGVMVVQTLARVTLVRAYHRAAPPPEARRRWGHAFTLGALVGGICWGAGSLLMVTPAEFDIQLLVCIVICAIVYGSLSGFGSYMPFYALLFPALLPLVIWSAFQNDPRHIAFAALGGLWVPIVAWLGYRHDRNVLTTLNLRYENLDLLQDLRVQKERAEKANMDKSRFLASASHDLRQPVHALGLFVGALRSHEMSEDSRRLLRHVEDSVGALDGLFTSLLDISRLDAGVIHASPSAFAIQPLLERICRDFEGETRRKDIRLRLRPTNAIVTSDPVLLERILRNILSNAVRYTERGGVLVGCRVGRRISVEVWDTGQGIADAEREQVFQEFYQIGNPGRDRSKGLGLGLAIVRRLTGLLDHPLTLKSRQGRGSVFKVAVPPARRPAALPPIEERLDGVAGGLILVIDDEVAIQQAMRGLLESWGHRVIAAGSSAEMLRSLADCTVRPDLIICDYRLAGEDGIAVIRLLQSEFNEDIPAMLITGDTAPERLHDARESGFTLLHKPLSAERLRAAIQTVYRASIP